MGELRSLNVNRNGILRAVSEAPPEALLILIIDTPASDNTRITCSPVTPGARVWGYLSSVFQALANSAFRGHSK